MCGFDGIRRGNYVGGELIRRTEVEVRVGKPKQGKAAGCRTGFSAYAIWPLRMALCLKTGDLI